MEDIDACNETHIDGVSATSSEWVNYITQRALLHLFETGIQLSPDFWNLSLQGICTGGWDQMKSIELKSASLLLILALACTPVIAQTAGQDMKNAGTETKNAAKDTGHGVKTGTVKAYDKTSSGTKDCVRQDRQRNEDGNRQDCQRHQDCRQRCRPWHEGRRRQDREWNQNSGRQNRGQADASIADDLLGIFRLNRLGCREFVLRPK